MGNTFEERMGMASPLLRALLILATAILLVPGQTAKYPEEDGGMDLEVLIHVPPMAAGEGSKEKDQALLEPMLVGYRSDQALLGGRLNNLDVDKGYAGQAEDRMRAGSIQLLKRSAAEERRLDGRIWILKKRDSRNMDGRIRILKRAEQEMVNLRRLLEDQNTEDNTERQKNLEKRADNDSYNMDGRVRILKRADDNRDGKIRILKRADDNRDGKIR